MREWEFLAGVAERADCGILLDVNNVYRQRLQPRLRRPAPTSRHAARARRQFHLAGHTDKGTHLIDTHDEPIVRDVWTLYARR